MKQRRISVRDDHAENESLRLLGRQFERIEGHDRWYSLTRSFCNNLSNTQSAKGLEEDQGNEGNDERRKGRKNSRRVGRTARGRSRRRCSRAGGTGSTRGGGGGGDRSDRRARGSDGLGDGLRDRRDAHTQLVVARQAGAADVREHPTVGVGSIALIRSGGHTIRGRGVAPAGIERVAVGWRGENRTKQVRMCMYRLESECVMK